MGFFSSLVRIAKGEPVFQPPPANSHEYAQDRPGEASPLPAAGEPTHPKPALGPKVIPNVYIEECESEEQGDHLECELRIHNHSHVPVRLERLEFLGQTYNLNKTYLYPEKMWEYIVRGGHRPTNTGYHEAKLFFESELGDDFVSVHMIEYKQLADKTYVPLRIRFLPPVRDI